MNYAVIQKLAKASKIICKIMRIFLIVGFVVSLIGMSIIFALPDFISVNIGGDMMFSIDIEKLNIGMTNEEYKDAIEEGLANTPVSERPDSITVTENGVTMEIADAEAVSMGLRDVGFLILEALFIMAASYVVLLFVGRLAKSLSLGTTPFTEANIKHLRNIGIAALCATYVPGIIMMIIGSIEKIDVGGFSPNITHAVMILLYITLVFIFRYGVTLEKAKAEAVSASAEALFGGTYTPESDTNDETDGDADGESL